jgi:toxin HigB-1
MIRSFRNKGLERFAETGDPSKLSVQNIGRVERILQALLVSRDAEEMNLPGYHLHALSGRDKGRFSVRVTGNWRITFGWDGEDAVDVDLEDYH